MKKPNKGNDKLTDHALTVLDKRYFLKDANGNIIEDWDSLCWRVANHVANDEKLPEDKRKWSQEYFDIINQLYFIPNSPVFTGSGRNGNLLACFVLPVVDSLEKIMDTAKFAALIHKSGGGTGFSFSRLRAKGSAVQSTFGVASGPVSFMEMYDGITEKVKQGGTRRGANMGILRVDHPDILEFISCKQDTSKITNFNISVAITDKFMKAYYDDKEYDLIDPSFDKKVGSLNARMVFNQICQNAWNTGEPGLFFIDKANATNKWKTIEATNPCGEQPLPPNDACDLGSINLAKYINIDGSFNKKLYIKHIHIAVRFLDSVISVNNYPLDIIKETHGASRKIGLGVMGFADMLVQMGVVYGSSESYEIADDLYGLLYREAKNYSAHLAKEKGVCDACKELGINQRNYWVTTVAPTGTISIIAGASSGIEPFYSIMFESNRMDGTKMIFSNPLFESMMELARVELTDKLKKKILSSRSIQDIKEIPENIRKLFVTAADIVSTDHVRMQAIFQKYSDSGISKTINLLESALVEDVRKAYELAYELDCKGVTVYRDNSRPNQVLSVKKEEKEEKKESKIRHRSDVLEGRTYEVPTALGKAYVTVNHDDSDVHREVLITIGKTGEDTPGLIEGAARLVSLCLKYDIPVEQIGKQLRGIRGEEPFIFRKKKYHSLFDFIGRTLLASDIPSPRKILQKCPVTSCGGDLIYQENCLKCMSCGWSKC